MSGLGRGRVETPMGPMHFMAARSLKHRETAHRMNDRGTPIDVIAKTLETSLDVVNRWLRQPKPDLPPGPNLDDSWMESAVCRTVDPELWHPQKGQSGREAKRICNTKCPVREACLVWALAYREPHGIWGGVDEATRKRMRGEMRRVHRKKTA